MFNKNIEERRVTLSIKCNSTDLTEVASTLADTPKIRANSNRDGKKDNSRISQKNIFLNLSFFLASY